MMIRRVTFVAALQNQHASQHQKRFWSGHAKGQLSTNDYTSTASGRSAKISATQRISDLDGIVTTNEGMLINKSRIQSLSNFNHDLMSQRTMGVTSLAFQVRQLETVLFFQKRLSDLNPRFNGLSGFGQMDFVQRSAYQRKDPKPMYDDFFQQLLDERKPNAKLTPSEVKKLRAHQQLVRSEMHARVHMICEHCFVRGHDANSNISGNGTLSQLAALFNIFRLTRLSFTLDGEIVFTDEGSMIWRSITERNESNLRKQQKQLFTDSVFHRLISGSQNFSESNDGEEAILSEKDEIQLLGEADSVPLTKTSTKESRKPSLSTAALFNPAVQKSNLSEDMQVMIELAINATEMELRSLASLAASTRHSRSSNSDKADKETQLDNAAARRTQNRINANTENHIDIIADSLYMCGRGTRAVDTLLEAVEEASAVGGDEQIGIQLAKSQHPLLVERLVKFRKANIL